MIALLTLLASASAAPDLATMSWGRVADVTDDGLRIPLAPIDERGVPEIVGGTLATASKYQETVSLVLIDNQGYGGSFCTGSLIDEQWVLTAAHCLDDLPGGYEFWVFWGKDIYNNVTDAIEWEGYVYHPSYDPQVKHADIGLVKLAEPKTSAYIMALNDDPIHNGWIDEELTFIGFGITSTGGSGDGFKRYTDIAIVDYDNNDIVTYNGVTDTCQGDSGGPGVYPAGSSYVQVAITSRGGDCADSLGFNTRVDKYLSWVGQYTTYTTVPGSGPINEPDPEPEELHPSLDIRRTYEADDGPDALDLGSAGSPDDDTYAAPLFQCSHGPVGAPIGLGLLLFAGMRRRRS